MTSTPDVGTGEETSRTINRLGLSERVTFTGFMPDDDLVAIYNAASLLVLPSFEEGFGLPVVEALLSSTPVITSDNSSLPEAGGPDTCYIDPASIESISAAIEKIQNDTELANKMSSNGREYALMKFDPKYLTAKMISLYQTIQEEILT